MRLMVSEGGLGNGATDTTAGDTVFHWAEVGDDILIRGLMRLIRC